MKNLFKGVLVLLVALVLSCNSGHYQDDYRVIKGPQGQEMVVIQDDNGGSFLMDYLTFQALMNQGGYNSVLNQYRSNTNLYPMYNRNIYSNWNTVRNVPRNQFNYYHEEPTYREPTNITTSVSKSKPQYNNYPNNNSMRSNSPTIYQKSSTNNSMRSNPVTKGYNSGYNSMKSKPSVFKSSTNNSMRSNSSGSNKKSRGSL